MKEQIEISTNMIATHPKYMGISLKTKATEIEPEVFEVNVFTSLTNQLDKRKLGEELRIIQTSLEKQYGIKINYHQYSPSKS